MSTLVIKASHVGPGFLAHLREEFSTSLKGLDITTPVPSYTFVGPGPALNAMRRKYFPVESYDLIVEEPCTQ